MKAVQKEETRLPWRCLLREGANTQGRGSRRDEFTEAYALPTLGVLLLQVWNLLHHLSLLLKLNSTATLKDDGLGSALSIINSPKDHE